MGIVSKFVPDMGVIRRNRLWIKISIPSAVWGEVTSIIEEHAPLHLDSQYKQYFKYSLDNELVFYLPLNGHIPTLTFKSSYEKMISDMDFSTRAMADLFGGLGREMGGAMKGFAKEHANLPGMGAVKSLGGMTQSVGKFVQLFAGNVDTPKVWRNAEVDDLKMGGTIGFENIFEYSYFRVLDIFLQAMSIPASQTTITTIRDVINGIGIPITKDGALAALELSMITPPNNFCGVEVIAGVAKELIKPGPLEIEGDSYLLFSLPGCFVNDIEVIHGTEDGRGVDDTGVSRIASYSLTFTPRNFEAVVEGIGNVWKGTDLNNAAFDYKAPLIKDRTDYFNMALFLGLNLDMIAALPGYAFQLGRGLAGLPDVAARRGLTGGTGLLRVVL